MKNQYRWEEKDGKRDIFVELSVRPLLDEWINRYTFSSTSRDNL